MTTNTDERQFFAASELTGTEYLTFNELAAHLRVSERTVHRLVDSGELPQPEMFGRCRRFNRKELAEHRSLRESAQRDLESESEETMEEERTTRTNRGKTYATKARRFSSEDSDAFAALVDGIVRMIDAVSERYHGTLPTKATTHMWKARKSLWEAKHACPNKSAAELLK